MRGRLRGLDLHGLARWLGLAVLALAMLGAQPTSAGDKAEALWQHRLDEDWQPGGGGLCLHSIVPWPGRPDRLTVAVSAAGVWHTEDGGASWSSAALRLPPVFSVTAA